jgi:hypothetical protein
LGGFVGVASNGTFFDLARPSRQTPGGFRGPTQRKPPGAPFDVDASLVCIPLADPGNQHNLLA